MPKKHQRAHLSKDLVARLDLLLQSANWLARSLGQHKKPTEDEFVVEFDMRRGDLHRTFSELAEQETDVETIYTILVVARDQAIRLHWGWREIGRAQALERERRPIVPHLRRMAALLRETEFHWWHAAVQVLLTMPAIPRGWMLRRGKTGPLGMPWVTVARHALKAQGVKPKQIKSLLGALGFLPFP